jgi:SAM-dependent methyltransferase
MKLNKEYWENRYIENNIPWDAKTITTPLREYIDQIEDNTKSILLPGAGNGYEFDYLIEKGFTKTTVIDIAGKPLEAIMQRNPPYKNNLIEIDFFEHDAQYDLIIEQTFFCALHPELREKYVEKMQALLKPKGKIVGLLFQFPLTEAGPPFGGSQEEYKELFAPYFTIKTLEKAHNSIKPRKDKELFFIFEKK